MLYNNNNNNNNNLFAERESSSIQQHILFPVKTFYHRLAISMRKIIIFDFQFNSLQTVCRQALKLKKIIIIFKTNVNPLTAVSRWAGYKFFVTMYREPAGRLECYMQIRTASRRAGQNDTCKFGPSAGGPDIHIGPLFNNRKQNIFCYDIYGCTINRIYKKTYNMYISVFLWGSRWARNYFSNVKTKAVASDSRKVNGAQCRQSRRHS